MEEIDTKPSRFLYDVLGAIRKFYLLIFLCKKEN